MTVPRKIKIVISFVDPKSDLENRDREALRLLSELNEISEVESVSLVPEENVLESSKSIGGFFLGILTAEISQKSAGSLFRFLSERLRNKPIELEVEANGKHLKVSAGSSEELQVASKEAQSFISNQEGKND